MDPPDVPTPHGKVARRAGLRDRPTAVGRLLLRWRQIARETGVTGHDGPGGFTPWPLPATAHPSDGRGSVRHRSGEGRGCCQR
ncbi:hypothetical protein F750_5739 [Streptomyces sp. PAMC 26508]|nr:hypothetical protein F750_5739 [Streptomyces sp. PAMC 26508]